MTSPPHRYLLVFATISFLLGSALNIYNLKKLRTQLGPSPTEPLTSELPLTVNPAVLNFLFAQHYEITNDSEWATLLPNKGSRVRLPSKQQRSMEDDFEVALYHDLHCLDVIRSVFVSMRDGSSAHSPEAEECLGTIRQAILCTADITLEPAEVICYDGEECNDAGPEASGNNVDHSCRDWVQVRKFVESNQKGWNA
ncbi:hypothetical protein GGU11DRAFT_743395 [Lentinula aff. detonsa]|nr:hypothetical protein GGU10DRAFT_150525 [Lentinula aff. detonsa]KAJ3799459.1 hypothetical protein GGU11DRAFT_743395 [Lentinula aff. detonsa]